MPAESSAVVHTPPRQQSTELPPLLSYEELIQRALRRELDREPTAQEVEEEIRMMAIRNTRAALGSSGSDPYGSHLSSDTERTDATSVQEAPLPVSLALRIFPQRLHQ